MPTADEIKNNRRIYKTLLNNLLNVKKSDPTIFTNVDNKRWFDIHTKFGKKVAQDILTQISFKLELNDVDLPNLVTEVKSATTDVDVINAFKKYNIKLEPAKITNLKNKHTFDKEKNRLVVAIEKRIQKRFTLWQMFIHAINDINMRDNIWPLHVATGFISIAIGDSIVYGPLLLRKVNLLVKNNSMILQSMDNWEINESLLFLLKLQGLDLSINEPVNLQIPDHYLTKIEKLIDIKMDLRQLQDKFIPKHREDIKNLVVKFHPGTILGLFQPSGGNLRKLMLKIIDNGEVDDIINVEADKNIYRDALSKSLRTPTNDPIRIQNMNFSQSKALASSMIQDTIIWGPPGTGKSQVIANLIANIIYKDKKAIVLSRKKAALDVLKKRLSKLTPFAFFILNDKNGQNEFFKTLKEFVHIVENRSDNQHEIKNSTVITEPQITALKALDDLYISNKYDAALEMLKLKNINESLYNCIYKLDKTWKYPIQRLLNINDCSDKISELNSLKIKKIFKIRKYEKNVKLNAELVMEIWSINDSIDINKFIKYARTASNDDVLNLIDISKKLKVKNVTDISSKYEDNIVQILAERIMTKIQSWKNSKSSYYRKYIKFANLVRHGKRQNYVFLKDHADVIKELFPVIVTTPETALIINKKNYFDYAIIDEASQMFSELGLPILYMAKIKILAGDQQQMQPSRWFQKHDDNNEEDIEENANSILDYAFTKGVYPVMLNKNYRSSSAALMAFSAKEFYNSELEVINKKDYTDPAPIEVINVNGKWEKGINKLEADMVVNLAIKNLSLYDKIILLAFNYNQKELIEEKLVQNTKLLTAYNDGKIILSNIENIQGDEADLVIASIVYDETTGFGGTYVAKKGGRNALNVAISRAKEKMIVIKSLNEYAIKKTYTDDLVTFRKWLHFLDLPIVQKMEYSKKTDDNNKTQLHGITTGDGEVESGFELNVLNAIRDRFKTNQDLELQKQYPVGSKRIDLAFILKNTNEFILGVEVDGYAYHHSWQKYLQDYARQEFLEAKGYCIFRVQEIDWKQNQEEVLVSLSETVNNLLQRVSPSAVVKI